MEIKGTFFFHGILRALLFPWKYNGLYFSMEIQGTFFFHGILRGLLFQWKYKIPSNVHEELSDNRRQVALS